MVGKLKEKNYKKLDHLKCFQKIERNKRKLKLQVIKNSRFYIIVKLWFAISFLL